MPTKAEVAINRALSATELSEILRRDFEALISKDGLLSSRAAAFGRISYEIRINLHLSNPAYPEHPLQYSSRRVAKQEIEADPRMDVIKPHPLAPEPNMCNYCGYEESMHPDGVWVDPENPGMFHNFEPALVVRHGIERSREISSPNLARVQHQMPITIETRGIDGSVQQKEVIYPKEIAENEGPQPMDREINE